MGYMWQSFRWIQGVGDFSCSCPSKHLKRRDVPILHGQVGDVGRCVGWGVGSRKFYGDLVRGIVKKTYLAVFASFGFALLVCASLTYAQTTISGEVTGTVADPSGAFMPNVTVTLKSIESGNAVTTTTGESGNHRSRLLGPGQSSVSATAEGFERIAISNVTVSLGQVTNVNALKPLCSGGDGVLAGPQQRESVIPGLSSRSSHRVAGLYTLKRYGDIWHESAAWIRNGASNFPRDNGLRVS